ncbi:PepSY domain-containing protein [Pararhizobium antarcticum]|uniref:PepSY domain-containing protein n=1 Tax=Pararhizobium antarcticum TaxID=1798805 RepID=A0A657LV10_9HYPH|nr:PepSY domain-containing protein [Pararhizobium antarcticum]OJF97270.1 hypothetical protein AX761_15295 [Rhizobium sp. 58]OJF99058.1 hypothetical protein AX760_13845 [Pararhizobium antarcticum]
MQKTAIFAALGLLVFSSAAFADDDNASCTSAPHAEWMSTEAISAKAVAAGYKDIRQVKTEGTCYEIYAMTTKGERAEVIMNPVNGDVVRAEIDN